MAHDRDSLTRGSFVSREKLLQMSQSAQLAEPVNPYPANVKTTLVLSVLVASGSFTQWEALATSNNIDVLSSFFNRWMQQNPTLYAGRRNVTRVPVL